MLPILLAVVYTAHAAHKNRKEVLSRITKYELLELTTIDTSNPDIKTLSFDLYTQHYEISLERNHDMTPTYTHTNVDPTTHKHQYFTALTKSCHFHGTVLNTQHRSVVSMSLCPKRGIRGRIEAFNQTLLIQPSAYYLDLEKDQNGFHSLSDQVLIYRESDFNRSDVNAINEGVIDPNKVPLKTSIQNKGERRRLFTSSNPAQLEEMIVIGPVRARNYQSNYGDKWYQELHAKTADMINDMSAIYKATNWGSVGGVNSISIVFAGIHVIFDFTGDYSSVKPNRLPAKAGGACPVGSGEFSDDNYCAIDGNEWLGRIKTWVQNYLRWDGQMDNVQLLSDMKFDWNGTPGRSISRTLGWGYIGTVCSSSSVTDVSIVPDMGGEDAAVRTMAHELGHNFNMEHDGQGGAGSGCAADAGLMGYSDGTGFSSCSIRSIQEYFQESGGFTCIGTGWPKDFITNVDSGATPQPTPRPTERPTASPTPAPTGVPTRAGQTDAPSKRPTSTPSVSPTPPTPRPTENPTPPPVDTACIRVQGVDDYFYDGTYNELADMYNGKKTYQRIGGSSGGSTFIYAPSSRSVWNGVNPAWVWGDSVGSGSISVYCTEDTIVNCRGNSLVRYASNGWVYYESSSIDTVCGVAETCPGYNCVGVGGIEDTTAIGNFEPEGCYNGYKYYTNPGGRILCFSDYYSRWMISSVLCSPYTGEVLAVAGSQQTEVVSNGWFAASNGQLEYNRNVMVNDCGGGGALNIGDVECLNNNPYDSSLCMTSNNSLWSGARTFELYDKLCQNDAPIYQYTITNTSNNHLTVGGNNLGEETENVYYLHFHREKRWIDSNETVGQWLISKNEISVNSLAVCEKDNLLECVAEQWKVQITEYYGGSQLDGLLRRITDQYLSVSDGQCQSEEVAVESGGLNNEWIVIMVIVLLVVVCAFVVYCLWKKMSDGEVDFNHKKDKKDKKHKKSLGDQDQFQATNNDEAEMEEIEIEVSMEKQTMQTDD